MDNSETDNLESADSSVALPNQDEGRSSNNSDAKKPRSRKWLYIGLSVVVAVILLAGWSEYNEARKREVLKTRILISRIKDMGGEVYYTTVKTGYPYVDKTLRKINHYRWVNGSLTIIKEIRLGSKSINDDFLSEFHVFRSIEQIKMPDNNITHIKPLARISNLRYLDLGKNNISDLSPLAGLKTIKYLYISKNNIRDLSPLSDLIKITHLNINDNEITDLSPISGLKHIHFLNIYNNQIIDLSPLSNLKKIEKLRISGNQITDLTPLAGLRGVLNLGLHNNHITDLTPLAGWKKLSV